MKIDKTLVGPHGHWVQPHGSPAGDGRQKYAVCAPDESILAYAWGLEAATEAALAIADGKAVAR